MMPLRPHDDRDSDLDRARGPQWRPRRPPCHESLPPVAALALAGRPGAAATITDSEPEPGTRADRDSDYESDTIMMISSSDS